MDKLKKNSIRIKNIIFFIKNLKNKKEVLCISCGKPKYAHFNRNMENDYCFPYGRDLSKFNNDTTTKRSTG